MPFPLLAHAVAGLDPSVPAMPELLRDHGYRTHLVGKWHVGNAQRGMLPTKRGFDSFFGLVGGGFDHYTKEGGGQVDLWRCVGVGGPCLGLGVCGMMMISAACVLFF